MRSLLIAGVVTRLKFRTLALTVDIQWHSLWPTASGSPCTAFTSLAPAPEVVESKYECYVYLTGSRRHDRSNGSTPFTPDTYEIVPLESFSKVDPVERGLPVKVKRARSMSAMSRGVIPLLFSVPISEISTIKAVYIDMSLLVLVVRSLCIALPWVVNLLLEQIWSTYIPDVVIPS